MGAPVPDVQGTYFEFDGVVACALQRTATKFTLGAGRGFIGHYPEGRATVMESRESEADAGVSLQERRSPHGVAQTVDRLVASARDQGMTVFVQIDHAGGAREAEMALADMVVLVLGNPRVGTPLLQRNPRLGLDLPLRVLVWDDVGTTRISYRSPMELVRADERGGVEQTLARMAQGLDRVVDASI